MTERKMNFKNNNNILKTINSNPSAWDKFSPYTFPPLCKPAEWINIKNPAVYNGNEYSMC